MNSFLTRYLDINIFSVSGHLSKCVLPFTCLVAPVGIYMVYFFKGRPKNLPPGPYGYPYIGSLLELSDETLAVDFRRLGDKYGDIFCLWMGAGKYVIVLNSYDIIKEAFVTRGPEFANRTPGEFLSGFDIHDTLLNCPCDTRHKESRKITTQWIRKYVSNNLQQVLLGELLKLHRIVENQPGKSVPLAQYLQYILANASCAFLFGKIFDWDDPVLHMIIQQSQIYAKTEQALFMPSVIGKTIFTRAVIKSLKAETRELREFIEQTVHQHVLKLHAVGHGAPEDAIDAYLRAGALEDYGMELFINTILSLIPDGVHSAKAALSMIITYWINHPQYHHVVASEITAVVRQNQNESTSINYDGEFNFVQLSDRKKMPMTESFIMEVLRVKPVFQFGSPNNMGKDGALRKYHIPKGAVIVPNYTAVHSDARLFPDPDTFKPERFIRNGQFVYIDGTLPFGLGKRMCVAEHLMRNEMFFIFANLLLRYNITNSGKIDIQRDRDMSFFTLSEELPVLLERKTT